MSSNQVMAQGFMDSGYGGCLLMHRAYFLWLLPGGDPCPPILRGRYPSTGGVVNPHTQTVPIEAQFCTFSSSHLDGSMPSIHTSPTRAKQEEQVKYLPKHTPF